MSSWCNQTSEGKKVAGKDSKNKGGSKSKKVAQEHQPGPKYSADIATLFALEMEKAAPAPVAKGSVKAKAKAEIKTMPQRPDLAGRPGIAGFLS